jgi:Ca2+-binding RTX toxin-like protein
MSRQIVLSLAVAVAVLALLGGVVLAATKTCPETDCVGTREADTLTAENDIAHNIAGLEGNDIITGGSNGDTIYGDEGNDTITDNDNTLIDVDVIYGDEGNDTIDVREGHNFPDIVDCGPGKKDTVFFDPADTVKGCEKKNPGL